MRIIGGEYRSRIINMPKGVDIRPTQDKVRGAVFSILGDLNGKSVLELFAGSGAFGIEAISRGASSVTFVDNDFRCLETVRKNIDSLGIGDEMFDLVKANALSVLPRLEKEEKRFDLVFLDPPYHKGIARKCLINIDSYDILSPIGLVVVEHFKKDSLPTDLKTLIFEKERNYGDVFITIFGRIRPETV